MLKRSGNPALSEKFLTAKFYRLIIILSFFMIHFSIINTQQWVNVTPNSNIDRTVIGHFISEDEGWVFANNDTIYHTTDGAETWEIIDLVEDSLGGFIELVMIDESVGWLVTNAHPHNYFKTIDGCYSWEEMSSYLSHIDNESIRSMHFINDNIVT